MIDTNDGRSTAGMRVLVAVDGSPGSRVAIDLVNGLAWPDRSTIRFVSVIATVQDLGYPLLGAPPPDAALEQPYVDDLETVLEEAAKAVPESVAGETAVINGRPADAILNMADEFDPELIVAGSRGHGPIATMLLGSVAAELVDRARCPLLVARRAMTDRTLLAYDGSPESKQALALMTRWPFLCGRDASVISIAQPPALWRSGITPSMYRQVIGDYRDELAQLQTEYGRLASEAADQLKAAGVRARPVSRTGDPAHEILMAAATAGSDLVVLGSRGRTGLKRAVLGSVARNVLINAQASVLVVHQPASR
jgi:nucleotide-binding universal stress UspA family protein